MAYAKMIYDRACPTHRLTLAKVIDLSTFSALVQDVDVGRAAEPYVIASGKEYVIVEMNRNVWGTPS